MRQIFKNYLATFIKNWLQTIGTVLFILMMFAVVIGFLAAPLQIYSKVKGMDKVNNKFNQVIDENHYKYNSEFLYKFVYEHNKTSEGVYGYDQQLTQDGKGTGQYKEVLREAGLNDNSESILSPIFHDAVAANVKTDQGTNTLSTNDMYDAYAGYLRDGINDFSNGALLKTKAHFIIAADASNDPTPNLTKEFSDNVQAIISNIFATEPYADADHAMLSRGFAIVNAILTNGGFSKTALDLQELMAADKSQDFGTEIVKLMRQDMNERGTSTETINLISAQVFHNKLINTGEEHNTRPDHYDGTSLYAKMGQSEYSYDFLNYITRLAYLDANNTNAFNKDGTQKYNFQTEKSMFLSETSSSSLFPTMSVVLKTANNPDETNQIQLEEGRLPTKFSVNFENRQSILADVVSGKIVPEIVINSGYAKHNHLGIGDMIKLPEGPEHNNVSTLVGNGSSDDFLTQDLKYKIVGIGEKFDDSVPGAHYTPFMEKISTYTNAYVDDGWFDILKEAKWYNSSSDSSDFVSTNRITNSKGTKADPVNVFNFNFNDKNANNALYDITYAPFISYKNTSTMSSVNSTKIRVIIFIILGIAVLVLAFIFINFIITKELNETRKQIGIFKSFGYKISELSWIFAIKTFLTIFVGAVLGWIVSIAIQTWSAGNYMSSVMFKFHTVYAGAAFMCIIFIVIPVVFLIISYIMTLFYLKEPTLSLLSNSKKISSNVGKQSLLLRHLARVGKGFGYRLQQGFIKDSMGKFVVVQILFAIASLTFTLMFGAQDLMHAVADQGFSVLQKNTNHRYSWVNQDQMNIQYDSKDGRYTLDNPSKFEQRDFNYVSYKGNEKIGDVLNNSSQMSDSRYRENFLISSISNTFDVDKDMAFEMLMPLDFYLVKDANVNPADLPGIVNNLPGATQAQKDAAAIDAKIPVAMKSEEMAYRDYFLNWILSFRISIMEHADDGNIEGMDNIKKDLIDEAANGKNPKFTLSYLEKYADNWNAKYPDNHININMADIVNDKDKVRDQFNDTLFGLKATNSEGQKNNLFLADITKIITLELANNYADSQLTSELANYTPTNVDKGYYGQNDVVEALNKTHKQAIWQDFSPNKMKYWGMQDNPLMASMLKNSNGTTTTGSKGNENSGGGLSLSKMNPQTISLVMGAAMLGYNSKDIQTMPTISLNQAFFNKQTEALYENIPVTGVDDSQSGRNAITLFKYKDNQYGSYDNLLRHANVSDDTYKKLMDDVNDPKYPDAINAVVPYGLAKYKKLKVGDIFTVSSDTKQKRSIHLKVIGINKSVAFSLGGGWSIDVDYDQFAKNYFSSDLQKTVETKPIFNSWCSQEPMLQGDINLSDIAESVNKMKFVGKNLALSIDPNASVFGSIFNGMVDFSTLLGSTIDPDYRLITNPNVASTSPYSSVLPFNILRAGINNGISDINNILIVFMVLVAVMLLIILVVVMNIIIEQATPIILTLKSLGYNQKEINWITMGSYITGAVISFIVAYCVSLAVWNIFLAVAGSLWHIYVFMSYSWRAPVITFLVVGAILFIGWLVSDRKVQKIPLTLVTGFN